MALDAISGASYYDASIVTGKTKAETSAAPESANITITEVPSTVKTSGTNQPGKDQGQKDNIASDKQIKDAISKANNKIKGNKTRCEFSYNEDTKRVSIKFVDEDTQEVIKEVPPEETLEMIKKMWELAGLLVDERR